MAIHNKEIADLFNQLADLLTVEGVSALQVRVYRHVARLINDSTQSFAELVQAGEDLTQFPGISENLAKKIAVIVKTGRLPALEKEAKHLPPALVEMLRLVDLGPKRVKKLHDTLQIKTLDDLKAAAVNHKICQIPGFAVKTEAKILADLERSDHGKNIK